jgi:hypothetical protein
LDKLTSALQTQPLQNSDQTLGTKFFLKSLANEYGDMELLAMEISDKQKAAKAILTAKQFRTSVRACDNAVMEQGIDKVLDQFHASAVLLNDFLELLQDVPQDL